MSLEVSEHLIARQPPEAQAIIRLLLAKIAELEARLPKTPQNSSLPPSTQHPHAKPTAKKPKSNKKRGGQPGHVKHSRPLLPTEQCDEVLTLWPTTCRRCGDELRGRDSVPRRHQVYELPEIKPHVTEYQLHRRKCSCGTITCAKLPPGVSPSEAGPHLTALVALLMGSFRQSKRRVALFLSTVLNQPCSPSWVVKLQAETTAALRPAYEQLQAKLPTEPIVGIDESPTKEATHKAWLWTAVAPQFTLFAIRPTREATTLTELLGAKFKGVVTCDRAKMYFQVRRTQWCWAHLMRDFQALIDRGTNVAKRLGYDLRRPLRELFQRWGELRAGKLTRLAWRRRMTPIRDEIDTLLQRGMFSGESKLIRMCRGLYHHRERLWTFLKVEGVEPTNNASERALRPAVIWRKLSFGTQSAAGSRFVETILSVVETCRQQQRGAFVYLTAAIQARREAKNTPSLLPRV